MGSMSETLAAEMRDCSLSACGIQMLDVRSGSLRQCAVRRGSNSYGDLDTIIREDEGGVRGRELGVGHCDG